MSGGDTNQPPAFSSGTPHFFKIILDDTLQENKLRIPQKFERKCGETLSSSVIVRLPCGSKWKMKLTKNDGNIWFEEGWPDFVKHFSIKGGSVLIFRYEANSEFHVVIFDTSTAEIDYPSTPVEFDKLGVDLALRAPKEDVVEGDSIKILDDLSSCPKETEKSPLPYSQPCKRMGTKPTAHDGGAIQVEPEEILTSETLISGARTDETGRPSSLEIFPAKQASRCMSTPWKTSLNLERPPSSIQIARILRRVPFESEKPFFKVLMQPSYVGSRGTRVHVPLDFAMRHIKNEGDVVLSVPNGKFWSAQFTLSCPTRRRCLAILCDGWKEFVNFYSLAVGDVCIFELLDGTEILFEVSIVRFAEYECLQSSQAGDYTTGASKPKGRES